MKRIIPFVSILLICVSLFSPILAKADVDIGNNDIDIVSDDNIELGRKLSILETLGDLIANGVSSFTISNTESVDDYVDYLYDLIYSSSGPNPGDVTDYEFLSTLGDLQSLRNYLDQRTYFFAQDLVNQGIDDGLDTLDELFNELLDYNVEYHPNRANVGAFRNLSYDNGNNPSPQPDADYSFISNIGHIISSQNGLNKEVLDNTNYYDYWGGSLKTNNILNSSFVVYDPANSGLYLNHVEHTSGLYINRIAKCSGYIDIYVTTNDNNVSVVYSSIQIAPFTNCFTLYTNANTQSRYNNAVALYFQYQSSQWRWQTTDVTSWSFTPRTSFNDLSTCINYIYQKFAYVNVFVNGVPWALATQVSNPTLNIDGFLTLQGQNNPIQYEFPNGTQIDYKKLYQVIKNAIDNDNPVDMTTINNNQTYHDSHNTVYSPTIYNYYDNDNEEDEDLFISDLLDIATIPKFDVAYVHPIDEPFTNGMIIVQDGLSVIPNDILILFGAIFVLLLFVLMMNRFFE